MKTGICTHFDIAHLDNLEDYVYALGYLYSRVREAYGRPSVKTVEQLVASRQLYHAHATALALSGLFDKDKVSRLTRGKSYQDLAYDVIGMTNLFLENWAELEGKTILTRSQLVQAQATATALVRTLGERELNPGDRAELNLLYRQVYTLTYAAYNEARDALMYARRREKDVANIAPSLHEEQGRRKPAGSTEPAPNETDNGETDDAEADDGETEVAALAEARVPGAQSPGSGAIANRTSVIAPAGTHMDVRPGFPGAPSLLPDVAEG